MQFPEAHVASDTGTSATADRLLLTIATALDVPPAGLDDASSPDTVAAWDSLNHLNIVMAIEGEFGIALSADQVMAMRDVGMIRAILRELGVHD